MGIYFDKTKKKVYIDWDEKTKTGVEHWHGDFTPINVFYHPKQKNEIYRLRLKGKMPKWVERFASENRFHTGVTSDDQGKTGFWIANWKGWNTGEIPINSPSLDGTIHQLIKGIPDELPELKSRIEDNKGIVKENLIKNPVFFEDVGIYYQPESIEGNSGTLLIENDIFIDKGDLTDEEYAVEIEKDGRLEKVVFELTTPVPEAVNNMEEVEIEEGEMQFTEDELNNIILEEEITVEDELQEDLSDVSELELEITEQDDLEFGDEVLTIEDTEEITLVNEDIVTQESDSSIGETQEEKDGNRTQAEVTTNHNNNETSKPKGKKKSNRVKSIEQTIPLF